MYDPAYDGQDGVADAWVKICEHANQHKLDWIQSSFDFWRLFYVTLNRTIRDQSDKYHAAKRNGPPDSPPQGLVFRRTAPRLEGSTARRGYRERDSWEESMYANLPPPEDLVLAQLEIEGFLETLDNPVLQEVVRMRLASYTNDEIAAALDLSTRTVQRHLASIRSLYLERRRES
jgi:DNA-directed RNA polymerase specialized sigma24 family protein